MMTSSLCDATPRPATTLHPSVPAALLRRIETEYREMPGLCLTKRQMQRLWTLDVELCDAVVHALVGRGILRLRGRDFYVAARTR